MGANKLTKKQEALFGEMHELVSSFVDDLESTKLPCREFSLAYTKLEESEMWMARGFERLGYAPLDEGEDEGEGEDDGEDEDEDESAEANAAAAEGEEE